MKEGGGREEEPGIKLLPMPGLLASSAPCEGGGVEGVCGGPVCQASPWGRANGARLGTEACRGEGARREACLSFSFIYTATLPSNLLLDIPRKKPFSVEVNGPAQINGSVWVSPGAPQGDPQLAPPSLQPHPAALHLPLLLSTKTCKPLSIPPQCRRPHLLRAQKATHTMATCRSTLA